jgi:hypothetical protein
VFIWGVAGAWMGLESEIAILVRVTGEHQSELEDQLQTNLEDAPLSGM